MSANPPEDYVLRHETLVRALISGEIVDPESALFLQLVVDRPRELAATPFLHDVSWSGHAYDLVFTDGRGRWCAVEVKAATELWGSGRQRRRRREKARRNVRKLEAQTAGALDACKRAFSGTVTALGLLLLEAGRWLVIATLGPR